MVAAGNQDRQAQRPVAGRSTGVRGEERKWFPRIPHPASLEGCLRIMLPPDRCAAIPLVAPSHDTTLRGLGQPPSSRSGPPGFPALPGFQGSQLDAPAIQPAGYGRLCWKWARVFESARSRRSRETGLREAVRTPLGWDWHERSAVSRETRRRPARHYLHGQGPRQLTAASSLATPPISSPFPDAPPPGASGHARRLRWEGGCDGKARSDPVRNASAIETIRRPAHAGRSDG